MDTPQTVFISRGWKPQTGKLILISHKEINQIQKASQNNNCPILLICRSGNRSEKAGIQLLEAGMENITHITDGFEGDRDDNNHRGTINGWRFNGLPWEQC